MEIDLKTLILIIGISHLMQVLVFTYQIKANRSVFGSGWWLLWSVTEFFGFGLILLRTVPSLNTTVAVLQNPIILLGTIFVYIGVLRFFEQKIRWKMIIPLFVSFAIIQFSLVIIIDNITLRTLIFDVYIAFIAFFSAYKLFRLKNKSISSTADFNIALFIAHGAIFLFRIIMIISGTSVTNMFSEELFNLVQYFDALLIGLLWTFGFIIMLNQRLNSEISEAKLHFEQIFNTSPDGSVITRLSDGLIIDCNEGYTRMSGYPKSELIGKTTLEIHIWNNPSDRFEIINRIKMFGFFENVELVFQKKSGELLTGLMSGKLINIKEIPHLISVTRDITERKKIEEALKDSKEKFQQLADLLPQIIFESDTQGRLTYVNKQAYKIFGYDESENIIGFNTLDFYPPDDRKRAIENIKLSLSGNKEVKNNEYRMIRKDGSTFYGLVYSNPILKQGTPIGLRGIIVDITELKQTEEELNLKNEELLKVNIAKDKFFSIISHDLKSPFNSILGFSDLLLEKVKEKDYDGIQKFAEIILQSSHRAMNLLTNLMEWSRSQTGRIVFNPEYFEIVNLINSIILLFKDTAEQKNITISNTSPADIPVYADKDMISTVLRNLLSNAIKFTKPGGKIIVKLAQQPEEFIISIIDSGVGIPKNVQDKLFIFEQNFSTPGTLQEQGTGLGLVLCKDFVEKNGGRIWIESEVGMGSSFNFTLPK